MSELTVHLSGRGISSPLLPAVERGVRGILDHLSAEGVRVMHVRTVDIEPAVKGNLLGGARVRVGRVQPALRRATEHSPQRRDVESRELQLRRLVEQSPGTATLNGLPVGRGKVAAGRRRKPSVPTGRGRAVREVVDAGREWPSVHAAAEDLHCGHKTIRKMADCGEVLRWA